MRRIARARGSCASRLEAGILARVPDAVIHGRGAERAPHIVNVSVPGTDSESLLMALDLRGIAASAGRRVRAEASARRTCSPRSAFAPDLASAAIRMSLGSLTTDACIDRVIEVFPALVAKARQLAAAE